MSGGRSASSMMAELREVEDEIEEEEMKLQLLQQQLKVFSLNS